MSTGRTVERYTRVYSDGYDLSGYARSIGPLATEFAATPVAALSDAIKNVLVGHGKISPGTLNGFFDNTETVGLHAVKKDAGVRRVLAVALGIRGEPAAGDPVFMGEFEQLDYKANQQEGYVAVTIPFGDADAQGAALAYGKPWGFLLHAKQARTAVNSSAGLDDWGAATSLGGFLCYQIFSSDGTVTVKAQDSADNSSFSDISGLTSGSQDASSTPKAGIVALTRSATIRRYTRWQVVFGTATTVTFALALVRATF